VAQPRKPQAKRARHSPKGDDGPADSRLTRCDSLKLSWDSAARQFEPAEREPMI
jgi:hypothetical protein